ncbi:MAG: hypothetical protein M1372_03000 [Patescibacteria group bacterium]|nr:hypothetical protein [Patescibacteria group bacterium]
MNKVWFKKWGWIHRPTSTIGLVITFGVLLLIVWIFMVVDKNSHSASDTLIGTFPWAWIFLATLNWIASKTSK